MQSFHGPYAARDKALFTLGILSGFRITELLSLRIKDVLQHGRMVDRLTVPRRHMQRKTQSRTVILHPQAKVALHAWLEDMRGRRAMTPEAYVFQSRNGANQPISRRRALRLLQAIFRGHGMTGRLGTHSMRKTFANNVYERLGRDLVKTQHALGQQNITTTICYLSFREEEIEAAILAL
jgi:site-specific recombinase XerD